MHIRYPILISAAIALLPLEKASAQSDGSNTGPCLADPQSPTGDQTLTDQLDHCNGVLTPPKVGDGEIVEPAPDAGTIIVVPPGALPEQQSETETGDASPATAQSHEYDLAEIVEAISSSEVAAMKLQSMDPAQVEVYDISILLGGANAAVLNTALAEHSSSVSAHQSAIVENPKLASAVTAEGLTVPGIVAANVEDGIVTFFGR